jgi:Hypothetical protein (DUF2513).
MKRDMDLIRMILFRIEEEVDNTVEYDLSIEGFSLDQVAYHCSILYNGGYIKEYKASYAEDEIDSFLIGGLTWSGHEFLEVIRNDTVWIKTKETVKKEGLSLAIEVIKKIASAILDEMTKVAIKKMML